MATATVATVPTPEISPQGYARLRWLNGTVNAPRIRSVNGMESVLSIDQGRQRA